MLPHAGQRCLFVSPGKYQSCQARERNVPPPDAASLHASTWDANGLCDVAPLSIASDETPDWPHIAYRVEIPDFSQRRMLQVFARRFGRYLNGLMLANCRCRATGIGLAAGCKIRRCVESPDHRVATAAVTRDVAGLKGVEYV
ncbi:hypothetical protein CEP88_01700 [Roseobacter denitrificans]|nr:hypothetical protein CEP88_01700 [Roseobacter denitrificans]